MDLAIGSDEKRSRMVYDVKSWYEDALRDLERARECINLRWYPDSCFHSQRLAEKILKSFLRSKGVIARGIG